MHRNILGLPLEQDIRPHGACCMVIDYLLDKDAELHTLGNVIDRPDTQGQPTPKNIPLNRMVSSFIVKFLVAIKCFPKLSIYQKRK